MTLTLLISFTLWTLEIISKSFSNATYKYSLYCKGWESEMFGNKLTNRNSTSFFFINYVTSYSYLTPNSPLPPCLPTRAINWRLWYLDRSWLSIHSEHEKRKSLFKLVELKPLVSALTNKQDISIKCVLQLRIRQLLGL